MELGNQIKALRLQRGVTQETLAEALNVSAQAVSKWEREAALPDIQLLPAISAYFGVTIDELFALSDETRIERIRNMILNERVLDQAMGGRRPDWCVANHHRLIDWYMGYVAQNPDDWGGCMWLIDQLMDDQRFDEAREYCDRLTQTDGTFRTPLYRGLIAWYEGDRAEAMSIWEQMQRDFSDEWCVWFSMGDAMARAGRYEEAKAYYRKGLEIQKPPRYTDGVASIAQICELQGDYPGAIAAHEEELAILAGEWDTTTGEQVDRHRREIARLKKKQG